MKVGATHKAREGVRYFDAAVLHVTNRRSAHV